MIKAFYNKYQYFFNMLAVLVFLEITRTLDSFAWAPPSQGTTRIILFNYLYEFVTFLPFLFLLTFSYSYSIKRRLNFLLYILVITYIVLLPTIVLIISTWLEKTFWGDGVQPISLDLIEKYTPGMSLVIIFLSTSYWLTYLKIQSVWQKESAHKAETLAKDIHLKMLRYQINPHFLFNVLNSIYALIDENTEKAKKLVMEMSEYYRYTLNKQQQTTSIEKEVESITKYLEIQKIRFDEEFQYEIAVDEDVKSIIIPTFIIHLLIENAVKYGKKSAEDKLIIRLSVNLRNKTLAISVSNTGKLLNASNVNTVGSDGTGNGLENIKYRLALFYNDNYSFSLKEEQGWVIAKIEINNINTK
jgi:two-component system, LytTR family, sensor kinase